MSSSTHNAVAMRSENSVITFYLIGLGGTGGWLAEMLVRYLLQNIHRSVLYRVILVDDDTVELKNTVRQHFFGVESVGIPKVFHMKAKLERIIASAVAYSVAVPEQQLLKVTSEEEFEGGEIEFSSVMVDDPAKNRIPKLKVFAIKELVSEDTVSRVFSSNASPEDAFTFHNSSTGFTNRFGGSDDAIVVLNLVDNNYTRRLLEDYWLFDANKGRKSIGPFMRGVQMLVLLRQRMLTKAVESGLVGNLDTVCFSSVRKDGAAALILGKTSDDGLRFTPIDSLLFEVRDRGDYSSAMYILLALGENVNFAGWLIGYVFEGWRKGGLDLPAVLTNDYIESLDKPEIERAAHSSNLDMFLSLLSSMVPVGTEVETTRESLLISSEYLINNDPLYIDAGNSDTSYMINGAGGSDPIIDFRDAVYDTDLSLPDGMISCADRVDTSTVAQTTSMNVAAAASVMGVVEKALPGILRKCGSIREFYEDPSYDNQGKRLFSLDYFLASSRFADRIRNKYKNGTMVDAKVLVSMGALKVEQVEGILLGIEQKDINIEQLEYPIVQRVSTALEVYAKVLGIGLSPELGYLISSTKVGSCQTRTDARYVEAAVSAFEQKSTDKKDEILVKLLDQ